MYAEVDDGLIDPEQVDNLPVSGVGYGSPLTLTMQLLPYAVSFAVAAVPTILALAKGLGQLRLNYAKGSGSNARRDATREEAEMTRSNRRSQEYEERLSLIREVADGIREELDEENVRLLDHFVRQASLRRELMQDSIGAIWLLSEKTVRVEVVPACVGGTDNDDLTANA